MPVAIEQLQWSSPPLFDFRASRSDLVARFGPPHRVDLDSNGVGLFDLWLLRFECGLEVAVWQFQSDPLGVRVTDDDAPRIVEIHANDRELLHLGFHVGVEREAIELWEPNPTHVATAMWSVMRQDDNGNRFVVASFTSHCEADAAAEHYANLGHKQLYWVEAPGSSD